MSDSATGQEAARTDTATTVAAAPAQAAAPAVETKPTETVTEAKPADVEKPQTIAEGATEAKTTEAEKPAAQPDWRDQYAGGDAETLALLKRIASPAEMAKKLLNQEKLIRAGEHKKGLPKDPTPEQLAEYKKENGIPDTADGYFEKLQLPDGVVLGDADKPIAQDYVAFALENNMPVSEVNKNMAWYYKLQDKIVAEQIKADDTFHDEAVGNLKKEWAGDFDRNTTAVNNVIARTAPKSIVKDLLASRLPDGRKFGDHPEVMKWLAQLSYEAGAADDHTRIPGGGYNGVGLDSRLAELKKMIADRSSDYYKGPNKQKLQTEYRELLDMQARAKSRAA